MPDIGGVRVGAPVARTANAGELRIENVLHEFSSLAGVRKDVTDIVFNVKQIALMMEARGPSG